MQTADIQQDIRDFLVNNFLFQRSEALRDDEPLLGNIIDSTGVVHFVMFLQEHFAITVEDDEVTTDNLDSLQKAAAFVGKKLSPKN